MLDYLITEQHQRHCLVSHNRDVTRSVFDKLRKKKSGFLQFFQVNYSFIGEEEISVSFPPGEVNKLLRLIEEAIK